MEHGDVSESARLQQLYAGRVAARAAGESAGCATPESILALVRREGSEEQRLATLEHVMSCAACHRDFEWLKAVDESGVEASAGTRGVAQRAWWRSAPLALAASVLVAVGTGIVLSGVLQPGADRERGAGRDIVLLSAGAQAGDGPIAFVWRALPETSGYVLEVQRQDGSVVLADTTRDTVAVVERARLAPGAVYRWWVREVTDGGAEPGSSVFRELQMPGASR